MSSVAIGVRRAGHVSNHAIINDRTTAIQHRKMKTPHIRMTSWSLTFGFITRFIKRLCCNIGQGATTWSEVFRAWFLIKTQNLCIGTFSVYTAIHRACVAIEAIHITITSWLIDVQATANNTGVYRICIVIIALCIIFTTKHAACYRCEDTPILRVA